MVRRRDAVGRGSRAPCNGDVTVSGITGQRGLGTVVPNGEFLEDDMSDRTRECFRACLACHDACLRAASYLQASEAAVALVRLLFNTADIVKTTASLLRSDLDVAEHAGRAVRGAVRADRPLLRQRPRRRDAASLFRGLPLPAPQAWQLMARAGAMA